MLKLVTSALSLWMLSSACLGAVVMTFDPLTGPNNNFNLGTLYSEAGFNLMTGGGQLGTYGSTDANYTGSASLFAVTPMEVVTLTEATGATFSMDTIDISENTTGSGAVPVTFTGNLASGGTITQGFTTDGIFGDQTVVLNGFTNLTSVSWVQVTGFHQFDNIVLNTVPEPSALGVLMVGLVGATRRRNRRS